MEKINYQVDRIRVNVTGEREGFSLAGHYEIDGTGSISSINVTARTEQEEVVSDKGYLTCQMGSPVFMVAESARGEGLTRSVTLALLQYYEDISANAAEIYAATTKGPESVE